MRFLHISHSYPPAIGGAEKYIADISEGLVQRGHQVDVFTSRALHIDTWKDVLPPFEERNGVNVYRFSAMTRRQWVWNMLHFGLRHYWRTRARRYEPFILLGGGPISPAMFWATRQRASRYDLVHLNCLVHSHVTYTYWAARGQNVPVVVTPHAHAGQEATYNIGYQQGVLSGCDHVIADTPAERALFLRLGHHPWHVSIGGTGVAPACYQDGSQLEARRQLGLPEKGFVVLFLGRKSGYKGIETVLRAYLALRPHLPHIHFLAVGPETPYSRALWQRYGDVPGLHVLDAVPHEEKVKALYACDCLVMPSAGEAFGIVFLEAWMAGKPVIGPRTPAVASVIDEGENGLLAAAGDVVELATCIARLAADRQWAQRMGSRGREKVHRRYTVSRLADRIEGIYLRVLRARRRAKETAV